MQAQLARVQKRLWLVLGASLVLGIVMLPRLENRRLVGALEELTAFRAAFVRADAERALADQAGSQGLVQLAQVEAAAKSKKNPKLRVAEGAPPVRPLTSVTLATLSDVLAFAQPNSALSIGALDPAALASSITWRLARAELASATLRGVELSPAQVTDQDLALEREVAELRIASLDARGAIEPATSRVEFLEQRVEFQSKRRSKQVYKTMTLLQEARAALAEKTRVHQETQARYDERAQAADHARAAQPASGVPKAALATVTLETSAGVRSMAIPVPLEVHGVPVTPLRGATFAATQAAGLWDEVKGLDADAAIEAVRGHFNWHLKGVKLGGLELLGVHLLQVLPLLLPLMLWLFLMQLRRAATSYNPFTTQVPEQTPPIGLKSRFAEFVVLLALPLLAVVGAAVSLVLVHRLPGLPLLAGMGCFALGGYSFSELRELREQTQRIVHTHSLMPPSPAGR